MPAARMRSLQNASQSRLYAPLLGDTLGFDYDEQQLCSSLSICAVWEASVRNCARGPLKWVLLTVQQAYVPILYEDLVSNPGPIGRLASPQGARRGSSRHVFSPTSPKPMAFELRAQVRPKTIMRVSVVWPL